MRRLREARSICGMIVLLLVGTIGCTEGSLRRLFAAEAATVPSGTVLQARIEQPLSSKSNRAGDRFEASLVEDLSVDGKLLAPAGSRITGRVTGAEPSGKIEGRAELSLALEFLQVEQTAYPIQSNSLHFQARGTKGEDAKKIGIGAGAGALIGALAGGKKGAAIGSAIGAGAGTGVVLATSGDEVELPPEHILTFELEQPVELPVLEP